MSEKYQCEVCNEGTYRPTGAIVTGGKLHHHQCEVCGAEKVFEKPNKTYRKPRKKRRNS